MPERRPSLARRLLTGLGALALASAALVAVPTTAQADELPVAPITEAQAAAVSEAPLQLDVPITAPPTGSFGQDVQFERFNDPFEPGGKHLSYRISVQSDNTVLLQLGSDCLQVMPSPFTQGQLWAAQCQNVPTQKFYFVPQNHNPTSAPKMDRGGQYFYLVSAMTHQCVWSASGGLNFTGDFLRETPQLKTCSEGDPGQEYRIYNETPNPDGIYREWGNILNLATAYASSHCGQDAKSCTIAAAGSAAGYEPQDPSALSALGHMTSGNFGCGTAFGNMVPQIQNSNFDQTLTIGVGTSNTVSNGLDLKFSEEIHGDAEYMSKVLDVWGFTLKGGFKFGGEQVITHADAQTRTGSLTLPVKPRKWLMSTWTGNVWTMTGDWQFAKNVDVLDSAHRSISWKVNSTGSYPVNVGAADVMKLRVVGQNHGKNCNAGPEATLSAGSKPVITDASSCTSPTTPSATVAVGTVLRACPGSWDVPASAGTTDPIFEYQWYVTDGDGKEAQEIAGATDSTFTVQKSTGVTRFLGVEIVEAGTPDRLQSDAVRAVPLVTVGATTGASAPAATVYPTNFAGTTDDARRGEAYRFDLVTNEGSAMVLGVASGLPDGLTFDPATGIISGTPTTPGQYSVTVTDTPSDGGEPQEQTVVLYVHDVAAVFGDDRDLTSTVGSAFSEALVPEVPSGMELEVVQGELPAGLALDPVTGVLSGTPTVGGRYAFSLMDEEAPETFASYSMTVSEVPTTFRGTALPGATVGAPYSADLVEARGTRSNFGLAETSAGLPQGLSVNPHTGTITGTPTVAGSASVTVIDFSEPANAVSVTVDVAAAGSSPAPEASGKGGSLAATGSPVVAQAAGVGLLGLSGLALLLVSRRRLRPSGRR